MQTDRSAQDPVLEVQGHTIVVLGDFNPTIFHPEWFKGEELLPADDLDALEVGILHHDIAQVRGSWLQLEARADRFSLATDHARAIPWVRDLAVSIFSLLRHTPTRIMGLNWIAHYGLPDEASWHQIGNLLAPKTVWEDQLDEPGLRALVIEARRPDDREGHIQVRVEPSLVVQPWGIMTAVNDHTVLSAESKSSSTLDVLSILRDEWDVSRARAEALHVAPHQLLIEREVES